MSFETQTDPIIDVCSRSLSYTHSHSHSHTPLSLSRACSLTHIHTLSLSLSCAHLFSLSLSLSLLPHSPSSLSSLFSALLPLPHSHSLSLTHMNKGLHHKCSMPDRLHVTNVCSFTLLTPNSLSLPHFFIKQVQKNCNHLTMIDNLKARLIKKKELLREAMNSNKDMIY